MLVYIFILDYFKTICNFYLVMGRVIGGLRCKWNELFAEFMYNRKLFLRNIFAHILLLLVFIIFFRKQLNRFLERHSLDQSSAIGESAL